MSINPKGYHIKSNEIIILSPKIVGENADTLTLRSVKIAGKQAWYSEIREGNRTEATLLRAGKNDPMDYSITVPLDDAFLRSQLIIQADTTTICNCGKVKEGDFPLANLNFLPFRPSLAYNYIAPADSVEKIFDLSGKANIVFKVNRTEIDWSYADNYAELDTILKTINVVRDNKDASVESISLIGYASPEGSYSNNVRLAKGRTEAVKDYVMQNSHFPSSLYHTSYVAEDWEGLREWLEGSSIPHRNEMIAFIADMTIPVESRNDIFRSRFPEEYPFLLEKVYPMLRHTDYHITYKVRRYYDVEEIKEVMKTNPRHLSLNELFLLANSCEPGSEEYDEAFTLAARLYPDNKIANLNAANSAINRGRYTEATRYLDRAGYTPQADYARGILATITGEIDAAEEWFEKAKKGGVTEAQNGLEEIERIRNYKGEIEIL